MSGRVIEEDRELGAMLLMAIDDKTKLQAQLAEAQAEIERLRSSPPGWREGIEAAAKVAKFYALDQESCERLQAETICYVIHDAIRALAEKRP